MGNQCTGNICQSAAQQQAKTTTDRDSTPQHRNGQSKILVSTQFTEEQVQHIVKIQSLVRGKLTRRQIRRDAEIKAVQHLFLNDKRLEYVFFVDADRQEYKGQAIKSDDGLKYIKQGYGILRSADNEEWHGYWDSDEFQRGKLISDFGQLTGEFINQKVNGYGYYESSDGQLIKQGQFKDDCFDGIGRKVSFEYQAIGQFKNEVLNGFGQLITANGCMQGEWNEGMFVKGLFIEPKSTYFGQMYNEMKHGKGVTIDSDQTLYCGEYSNSKKDGEGVYINAAGNRYYGKFQHNHMNGEIIKISEDETKITKETHDLDKQKVKKLKQNLVYDSSELIQIARSKIQEALNEKVQVEEIKKEYQKVIDNYFIQVQELANKFESEDPIKMQDKKVEQPDKSENLDDSRQRKEPDDQKSEQSSIQHIQPIQ